MLALKHLGSGKVRDNYEIDGKRLLIVASDRISAFDVVITEPIPDKGRVLTGLSTHWFDLLDTPHHLLSTDVGSLGLDDATTADLTGRSMIVKRADVIPMECVVRGYLYGSSWKEYASGGGPTTEHLPSGLSMADKLPVPLFTPATKAEVGDHDENLTVAGARELVGDEMYEELKQRSLDIYSRAADYAAERGIILADTKFEFGVVDGEIILIDEVLTPDSSRYWPADAWAPGATMPSYDKQPVRDWLEAQDWDKTAPAPTLPDDVIADTRSRYITAYELLTGGSFDTYLAGTR